MTASPRDSICGMDRVALTDAYAHRLRASLWGGSGKYASYAKANPGEASKIDAYVAAIKAGDNPTPPVVATDFGQMIVGLIAAGMVPDPVTPPPPPPPPSGKTRGVGAVMWGGAVGFSTADMARMDMVALDMGGDYAITSKIGGVPALCYSSGVTIQNRPESIPLAQAQANGWVLPIASAYGPIVDIFNPATGTAMGQHIAALCKQYGFKGVMLDDVVGWCRTLANALPPGKSDADWRNAIPGHVGRLWAPVKDAGLAMFANASGFIPMDANSDNGVNTLNFWNDLSVYGFGLCCEAWEENSADYRVRKYGVSWDQNWTGWRALHKLCNDKGIPFSAQPYLAPDTADCIYVRNSFYLDYKPGDQLLINPLTHSIYGPRWCADPGAALGAATVDGNGLWTRKFANELIPVDPR